MIRTLLLLVALACAPACGPTQHRVATVTLVGAGTAVATIHAAHQAAYTEATDRLRERLRTDGGSIADYDRQVAPIDAAFAARSRVLQLLDQALYAAAGVVDAARDGGGADLAAIAGQVLATLRAAVAVLRDGSVLPAVALPPAVDTTLAALQALAGGFDGGL